jgi:hypothetical protein
MGVTTDFSSSAAEPREPAERGRGEGYHYAGGGAAQSGELEGRGRREVATCAGQIVELVPEVQKDFHVRATLAGAPRGGVLDLTDGAGCSDRPEVFSSETVFAHSLDE